MDYKKLPKISIKPLVGIYFLISNGELIYIGQSKDIFGRIEDHKNDKVFDHFCYFECKPDQLDYKERKLIKQHKPKLNIAHKPVDKPLPEILQTESFQNFLNCQEVWTAKVYDEYFIAKLPKGMVYSKIVKKNAKGGYFRYVLTELKSELSTRGSAIFAKATGYFKYKNQTYYLEPRDGYFKLAIL